MLYIYPPIENSPVARAGLVGGELLCGIDGAACNDFDDYAELTNGKQQYTVTVIRNRELVDFVIELNGSPLNPDDIVQELSNR